jgi:CYTH domain-containing protein
MTIIRRFLLAPSFARLVRKERGSARVTEGYFATQSGRNSHVLVESGQCHLVLVTPEDGATASEERTEVPRAHADALLDVCAGKTVYERTRVTLGGAREALVDRITHPGALDLVSVEFESREDAATFSTPAWFGPEVTADAAFDRRAIALEGLPAAGEVGLSNAALEALLDMLEDRFGRTRFAPIPAPAPPRRATNDSSVIDALRRLASPDQPLAAAAETPAQQAVEDVSARPLGRRNFPARSEGESEAAASLDANPDARIDDVIASLSQALGTQAEPGAEPEGPAMPDVERPVTRLRRFGG